MIHGTTDRQTTWCGEPVVCEDGWVCNAPDEVECLDCLRAEIEDLKRANEGGVPAYEAEMGQIREGALSLRVDQLKAEIGRLLATLEAEQRASARAEAKIELLKAEVKVKERSRLAFSLELERRTAEVERLRADARLKEADYRVLEDKVCDYEAKLEQVIALHTEFRIYDECGHDHTVDDLDAGRAQEIPDVGLVCEEGYLYSVCTECHTKDGEVGEDTPDVNSWPCPTIAAAKEECTCSGDHECEAHRA